MRLSTSVGVLAIGLLGGCTNTTELSSANGNPTYLIACGALTGFDVCFRRANELCTHGYTTLSERADVNRKEVRVQCGSGQPPAPFVSLTPPPREVSATEARENSLLEDALSGRPDYTAALRRAAEANISESNPVVRQTRQQREARVDAEIARLSDAVEKRRRDTLASRAVGQQASQAAAARAQAIAACDAQASAVGASIQTPYLPRHGVLGSALIGAANSSSAQEEARAGCYRAYGL